MLTWRNGVARLILAIALTQFLLGIASYIAIENAFQQAEFVGDRPADLRFSSLSAIIVNPAWTVALAAVVEYLSRIADALQKHGSKE